MRPFACTVARTAAEIGEAQRVRWCVYGEEERLLPPSVCAGGREVDAHDGCEGTVHLLVRAGGEPVGTVRLVAAGAAPETTTGGLDLGATFDVRPGRARGLVPAEVTRYCVLRRYRCTGVAAALFAGLQAESQRRGITHWFAAANMETDCAEDAALAHRLVRARGLVDGSFQARPRTAAPARTPRRRPCYSEAQRGRALQGALDELPLPRTLALFASRMGARYIGPPAYDAYFGVFSLPLVAAVPGAPASP
jgi:L-ornithine Nalpha-acyltransferase